jgi:hypothetical protein
VATSVLNLAAHILGAMKLHTALSHAQVPPLRRVVNREILCHRL